ncbi:hypothetical protein P170DRAFT_24539 [Aspergillus steynii IBT 23096]|uniref:Uncharacterized protein n=1 Tax=Aspergillus steynii IBT 23096 TaxID=1392250 RepID=A0A2I2GPE4_9EURO|nr:uncharacterized protein P170DRAFT_24539 [Aspergillus steynii IBT 23096]PLB54747.1 hypothetical protein P170DRAFT_24539 [Aspergillus steynii IBT 23096]
MTIHSRQSGKIRQVQMICYFQDKFIGKREKIAQGEWAEAANFFGESIPVGAMDALVEANADGEPLQQAPIIG